jgi:hypothetical protein
MISLWNNEFVLYVSLFLNLILVAIMLVRVIRQRRVVPTYDFIYLNNDVGKLRRRLYHCLNDVSDLNTSEVKTEIFYILKGLFNQRGKK